MRNRKDNQGKIIGQIGCGFNCDLINDGLFDFKGEKRIKIQLHVQRKEKSVAIWKLNSIFYIFLEK